MKRGVLLVNMGGPANRSEVRPYLRSIFRDPAILPVPGFLRTLLGEIIVASRASVVTKRYQLIGGASPLIHWSPMLRDSVSRELNQSDTLWHVSYAFRYTEPLIETTMRQIAEQGINDIVLVPLFPHDTRAMTGSIESEAKRAASQLRIRLQIASAWGNNDRIVELWQSYLNDSMIAAGRDARVLFVAHGIPMRDVKAGDDYPQEVRNTVKRLAASLPKDTVWSVAFQSKVGPIPWTQPYLEDELNTLCADSKPLVIMPLSFAADCLETLYDLDLIAMKHAAQKGVEKIIRVRVFNDDKRFVSILANIIINTTDA